MSGRPTIVVVTERQLFPVNEGTRARIVTLVRSLRRFGFRVVLITARPRGVTGTLRTRWLVDAMLTVKTRRFPGGSPVAYDCSPFFPAVEAATRRYAPVAVIAEYIWMAPCLRAVRGAAVRLVDTHDVMHARLEFGDRVANRWVTCTAEEERALLEQGDVVVAIQPRERERFRELVPHRRVICVPHHVPAAPARRAGSRPIVAVVGSANPCNVEGLTAFLESAWPLVRRTAPGAELRIYGDLGKRVPPGERIVVMGHAKDLSRAYAEAAVVINPVNFGTGLKIKTVEALAHGKALVTTSCGAEGLDPQSTPAFAIADDMEQFGRAVVHFLADRSARLDLEAAAARFAATAFTAERVYAELLDVLRTGAAGGERAAALASDTR